MTKKTFIIDQYKLNVDLENEEIKIKIEKENGLVYTFYYSKSIKQFYVYLYEKENIIESYNVKEKFGLFFPKEKSFETDCLNFIIVFEKFLKVIKNPVRNPTIEYAGIYNLDKKITFVYYPEKDLDYNYYEFNDYTASCIINMTVDKNKNVWLKVWESEPETRYTDEIKLQTGSREFDYGIICTMTEEEKKIIFENPKSIDAEQIFKLYFHKHVNDKLKDPFIFQNNEITKDKEITWENGSEEELKELIEMFLYSQENLQKFTWPMNAIFFTETEYIPSDIIFTKDLSVYKELSEKIQILINTAIKRNIIKVSGWYSSKNTHKNKENRLSTYNIEQHVFKFIFSEPSPHQQIDSKIKFKRWINQNGSKSKK